MSVQEARERASSAIVSNARIEAAQIIDAALEKAQRIIRAADRDAATVRANARAYAARHNGDRPTAGGELYRQVMHERYAPRVRA